MDKNKNLKTYPRKAQDTISKGLKTGNVRFEKSKTGGEYIYSRDKSFGKSKTAPVSNAQYGRRMNAAIKSKAPVGKGVGGEPPTNYKRKK